MAFVSKYLYNFKTWVIFLNFWWYWMIGFCYLVYYNLLLFFFYIYYYCRLILFYFIYVTNNSITEFKLLKTKIQHIGNILKTGFRHTQYFVYIFLWQKIDTSSFHLAFIRPLQCHGMYVGVYKYILNYNKTYYIVLYNHNY